MRWWRGGQLQERCRIIVNPRLCAVALCPNVLGTKQCCAHGHANMRMHVLHCIELYCTCVRAQAAGVHRSKVAGEGQSRAVVRCAAWLRVELQLHVLPANRSDDGWQHSAECACIPPVQPRCIQGVAKASYAEAGSGDASLAHGTHSPSEARTRARAHGR